MLPPESEGLWSLHLLPPIPPHLVTLQLCGVACVRVHTEGEAGVCACEHVRVFCVYACRMSVCVHV